MTTAELGQLMVLQKLTSLGASNAIVLTLPQNPVMTPTY